MSALPEVVQRLQQELGRLPGIGPRSAERLAFHLIQTDPTIVQQLADSLVRARAEVQLCDRCGAFAISQPCALCEDSRRNASLLCVVERPVDVLTLEKSRAFAGRYHVLGGVLSPLNGVGPEDLRLDTLEQRLAAEPIQEIVVALSTSVEGDATGQYLAERFARDGLYVTRIAYGLPAGSGLEFADEVTLSRALEGRRELS